MLLNCEFLIFGRWRFAECFEREVCGPRAENHVSLHPNTWICSFSQIVFHARIELLDSGIPIDKLITMKIHVIFAADFSA